MRGRTSRPSSRAAVSARPWVSTRPMTTSRPSALSRLARGQHGVGLADAGRGAEEDLELAAPLLARQRQQRVRIGAAVEFALRRHALFLSVVERQIEQEHIDARLAEKAEPGLSTWASTRSRTLSGVEAARLGDGRRLQQRVLRRNVRIEARGRGGQRVGGQRPGPARLRAWRRRRPSPGRSAPCWSGRDWSRWNWRRYRARRRSCSSPSGRARWSPRGAAGNSVGEVKFWPISAEPTTLPSRRISEPPACQGNRTEATPVSASG